ncbi:hypothetical protein SH668x_002327 [Planctomicrobium sp. SH668]|uniref:hypothetical protein n=1 Tax=Planctomicrobium sp. SH668 TaxID=3448126 RepID=UPI003F5C025F
MSIQADAHQFDIDAFFKGPVHEFTSKLASLERRIPKDQSPAHDEFLEELTRAIHESREFCEQAQSEIGEDSVLLKSVQAKFRDAIQPWFDQSWFMLRAKNKPRGYPGDYAMLAAIYDGKTKGTGFGGYLDLYFLGTDLARAVCSRLAAVKEFLIDEVSNRTTRFSILNVASGPGREYTQDFEPHPLMQLTCVDTDEQALAYLKANVKPETAESLDLNCVCYNALKMTSSKANLQQFGRADMIYSVGLCDYIPDRYLIRILNGWRESVAENGIVYVAFKDEPTYRASEYQWHVDWHFYQRTEEDCFKLFAEAGYDIGSMVMTRDTTGIIMNFVARDRAINRIRIDGAHELRGPHTPADADLSETVASGLDFEFEDM